MLNAFKLLAKGVIEKAKTFKGDWNENDSSSPHYVKNRPFYSEQKIQTVFSKSFDYMDFTHTNNIAAPDLVFGLDAYYYNESSMLFSLQKGEEYTVIWEDVEYKVKVDSIVHEDEVLLYLGNRDIFLRDGSDNGKPFFIMHYYGSMFILCRDSLDAANVEIKKQTEKVHKIDKKYLPETVGQKGKGKNAEIFNYIEYNDASGDYSHAEGRYTIASGEYQHVQGKYNIEDTDNKYAHIVGNGAGLYERSNAHTLDWDGNAWFAGTVTIGADNKELATKEYVDDVIDSIDTDNLVITNSISIGRKADTAVATRSAAIGYNVTASGYYSHAEGYNTTASGESSHAEGRNTTASGYYSHAEGYGTTANALYSHAEGRNTTASGYYSHAEGYGTIATTACQHVQGRLNIEDASYVHIVGNGEEIGTSEGTEIVRSNAHTLDWDGNAWYQGNVSVDGTPTADNDLVTKKYVDNKLAGLQIVQITQAEYDALSSKDNNTLYLIIQ